MAAKSSNVLSASESNGVVFRLLKSNIIEINKQKYKYFKSRDIEGIVQTITIKRDTLGDIYLYFVCETNENKVLSRTGKSVAMTLD